VSDVANAKIDEIAAAQLAVNGEIEQRQISNLTGILKMNTDRPDVLGLERWLLPYQFAFVPGFPRVIGFHVRLLVVDRSLIVWRATGASQIASILNAAGT